MKEKISIWRIILIAVMFVTSILTMWFSFVAKSGNRTIYFVIDAVILASCLIFVCFDPKKHGTVVKVAFLAFIASVAAVYGYYICVKTGVITYLRDFENIKKIILSTGNFGIVCFFLITVAEILFLPIPAAVTIIAGTLVYGPFISFAVSSIATFIGSIAVFLMGRWLGKKLLYWLFDRNKVDKFADILGKRGKAPFIIMMLLPFFPDDVICISAGVTSMSFGFFAVAVAITRTIYIFVVSYLGEGKIIPFSGWGIAVWVAICVVLVVLSIVAGKFFDNKQERKKEQLDADNDT